MVLYVWLSTICSAISSVLPVLALPLYLLYLQVLESHLYWHYQYVFQYRPFKCINASTVRQCPYPDSNTLTAGFASSIMSTELCLLSSLCWLWSSQARPLNLAHLGLCHKTNAGVKDHWRRVWLDVLSRKLPKYCINGPKGAKCVDAFGDSRNPTCTYSEQKNYSILPLK